MIIKTLRDPYNAGFSPTKPKEIELNPGLTVLVGCNGAGKSTLISNIKRHCTDNKIPVILYDNLADGGHNSINEIIFTGKYEELGGLWNASEGEAIKENVGRLSAKFAHFFEFGYVSDKKSDLHRSFMNKRDRDELDKLTKSNNDRVILFDAVDSGLSVDSVIEIKKMFELMVDDIKQFNKNIYIIIAANEYELARNVDCFDVNNGVYLKFTDYEDYRKFIIKSRIAKEKRIEKQLVWRKKQADKERIAFVKLVKETQAKMREIVEANNYEIPTYKNSNWSTYHKFENLNSKIKDAKHHLRFISDDEAEAIINGSM